MPLLSVAGVLVRKSHLNVQMIAITKPSKAWNSMNTRPRMNGWNKASFAFGLRAMPSRAAAAVRPCAVAAPKDAIAIVRPAPIGTQLFPADAEAAASWANAKELKNKPPNAIATLLKKPFMNPYPTLKSA